MTLKKTLIAWWIHPPEHWYTASFTKLRCERTCWSDAVTLDQYKWYLVELSKPDQSEQSLQGLRCHLDTNTDCDIEWSTKYVRNPASCMRWVSLSHDDTGPCREILWDRTSGNNQTSGESRHVGILCVLEADGEDDERSSLTWNVGKWEVCSEWEEHVGLKSTLLKCSSVRFTIWCDSSSSCDLVDNS